MRASNITLDTVKQYLRAEEDDIQTLEIFLSAAKAFVICYTGLREDQLDDSEDLTAAILTVCSDLYDNRQMTAAGSTMNPVVQKILDLHSVKPEVGTI